MTLQYLAISTLALGLALVLLARLLRGVPPCCARCHFPVDQSRPDLTRCPECGSDLRTDGAIVTRAPAPKLPRRIGVALLLCSLCTAGVILFFLEYDGRLDRHKPTWALAIQFPFTHDTRGVAMERELVARRAGMPHWPANLLLNRWRSERVGKLAPTRYDPIAEALFPTGLVTPAEIESYSRNLLSFDSQAPETAPAGSVVTIETKIGLVASTSLRFEIERARFFVGGTQALFEPLPHVTIQDAGSFDSISSSGLSHATTNYVPVPAGVAFPVETTLDAQYAVSVYVQDHLVCQWSHTQSRPIRIIAPAPK